MAKGNDLYRAYARKKSITEMIILKCKSNKIKVPDLSKYTTKELLGIHGRICEEIKNEK